MVGLLIIWCCFISRHRFWVNPGSDPTVLCREQPLGLKIRELKILLCLRNIFVCLSFSKRAACGLGILWNWFGYTHLVHEMIYSQPAEDPFFTGANDKNPWLFKILRVGCGLGHSTVESSWRLKSLTGLSWFIYKPLLIGRTQALSLSIWDFKHRRGAESLIALGWAHLGRTKLHISTRHPAELALRTKGNNLDVAEVRWLCWCIVNVFILSCPNFYLVHFLAMVGWLSYLQADFGRVSHLLGCYFWGSFFNTHFVFQVNQQHMVEDSCRFQKGIGHKSPRRTYPESLIVASLGAANT